MVWFQFTLFPVRKCVVLDFRVAIETFLSKVHNNITQRQTRCLIYSISKPITIIKSVRWYIYCSAYIKYCTCVTMLFVRYYHVISTLWRLWYYRLQQYLQSIFSFIYKLIKLCRVCQSRSGSFKTVLSNQNNIT